MPAVLDEAYVSPFDKVLGGPAKGAQSSDTGSADIRAGPYGISGGRSDPYQQDFHIPQSTVPSGQSVQPVASMSDMASVYNTLPTLTQTMPSHPIQYPTEPSHNARVHRCDELVDQIMSCRECRQKLRAILIKERMDKLNAEEEEEAEVEQSGGGLGLGLGLDGILNDQGFLVNFIIGIAVLFLLDRIIKLKTS